MEMLTKLYVANGYDIEEAMDAFDSNFMNGILEPADASYHLGRIASKISIESIKQIVDLPCATLTMLKNPLMHELKE